MILKWYSPSGVEIVFSRDSDTYKLLLEYSGFSNAPVTHLTKQAPYQDGVGLIDSHLEPRDVSFDVLVTAPTLEDLQYAIRILTTALNPIAGPGALILTQEDGNEYVLYCVGNNTPTLSTSTRTNTSQLVTIDLVAQDPAWYSYPTTITYFGAGTPLVYPYAYPYAYPVGTPDQTVVNQGNLSSAVRIVINGAVTNPVISRTYYDAYGNPTTESLSFALTMIVGDILTITTGFGNKTITYWHSGAYDANPFQHLVAGSKFWQLVTGNNLIAVTYDAMAAETITSVESASKFTGI